MFWAASLVAMVSTILLFGWLTNRTIRRWSAQVSGQRVDLVARRRVVELRVDGRAVSKVPWDPAARRLVLTAQVWDRVRRRDATVTGTCGEHEGQLFGCLEFDGQIVAGAHVPQVPLFADELVMRAEDFLAVLEVEGVGVAELDDLKRSIDAARDLPRLLQLLGERSLWARGGWPPLRRRATTRGTARSLRERATLLGQPSDADDADD